MVLTAASMLPALAMLVCLPACESTNWNTAPHPFSCTSEKNWPTLDSKYVVLRSPPQRGGAVWDFAFSRIFCAQSACSCTAVPPPPAAVPPGVGAALAVPLLAVPSAFSGAGGGSLGGWCVVCGCAGRWDVRRLQAVVLSRSGLSFSSLREVDGRREGLATRVAGVGLVARVRTNFQNPVKSSLLKVVSK